MVSWKVVLVMIVVIILTMAVGMWFGYRYVSEQEDISPEGHHEPSATVVSRHNLPIMLAAVHRKFQRNNFTY